MNNNEGMIKKNKNNDLIINTNNSMNIKEVMRTFRCISIIGITLAIISIVLTLTIGGILTYASVTSTKDQLVSEKYAIRYFSLLNNQGESEIVDEINSYTSSKSFAFNFAIVPSLVIVGSMIVLLAISIKIHRFTKNTSTEAELFSNEKLNKLKELRKYVLTLGLFIIAFYDLTYILIYIFIEAMLELIIYLFNSNIKLRNN